VTSGRSSSAGSPSLAERAGRAKGIGRQAEDRTTLTQESPKGIPLLTERGPVWLLRRQREMSPRLLALFSLPTPLKFLRVPVHCSRPPNVSGFSCESRAQRGFVSCKPLLGGSSHPPGGSDPFRVDQAIAAVCLLVRTVMDLKSLLATTPRMSAPVKSQFLKELRRKSTPDRSVWQNVQSRKVLHRRSESRKTERSKVQERKSFQHIVASRRSQSSSDRRESSDLPTNKPGKVRPDRTASSTRVLNKDGPPPSAVPVRAQFA
jgi:hypothetical protein